MKNIHSCTLFAAENNWMMQVEIGQAVKEDTTRRETMCFVDVILAFDMAI